MLCLDFCGYQICRQFCFYVFVLVTIFLPILKWTKSVRLFLLCSLQSIPLEDLQSACVYQFTSSICSFLEDPMSVLELAAGADTVSHLPDSFGGFPNCFCACCCTTSACVCLEGLNLFLCSLMHHVCLCLSRGSKSVFVPGYLCLLGGS